MYCKPLGLLVGSNPGVIGEKNYPHEKNTRKVLDTNVTLWSSCRLSAYKPGFCRLNPGGSHEKTISHHGKTHPHSILQVPTTQLAKMSIDPKFVELTADVLEIFL